MAQCHGALTYLECFQFPSTYATYMAWVGMGAATSHLQSWVHCGSWFANKELARRQRWGYGHTHSWACVQFPSTHAMYVAWALTLVH